MLKLLSSILFIFLFQFSFSSDDPYIGYWMMPNKKVVIEIEKYENEYIGHVRWLKNLKYPAGDKMEGVEQIDRNNPDINLRNRKVLGLKVVGGLRLDPSNNKLFGGWIYDSWNGREYYGSAEVIDSNTLKLKGSIDKWGLLSHSMIIKRVKLIQNKN